jgi:hypothetical protein
MKKYVTFIPLALGVYSIHKHLEFSISLYPFQQCILWALSGNRRLTLEHSFLFYHISTNITKIRTKHGKGEEYRRVPP